jgi:hypothetical protein
VKARSKATAVDPVTPKMNISDQDPDPKRTNPMADSWKPEDKAAESAFENPEEFDVRHPATEDSTAPVPSGKPKTRGEMEIRRPKLPKIPDS